jgi:hypothetical protein
MNYKKLLVTAVVLSFQSVSVYAGDALISVDYLQGRWSLDGKEGCASAASKYVLFRNNGTVEVGRGDQVTRVGFWTITSDNIIVGHTLTAPTHHEDYHPFFRDSYRYEYMSPQVVNTEQDEFSVAIGSDLEKKTVKLNRCP